MKKEGLSVRLLESLFLRIENQFVEVPQLPIAIRNQAGPNPATEAKSGGDVNETVAETPGE